MAPKSWTKPARMGHAASRLEKSSNHTGIREAGERERGARCVHKRLLYCVNVNRTSLDHLLLGGNADVDKMSHGASIARDRGGVRTGICLNFGFGHAKVSYRWPVTPGEERSWDRRGWRGERGRRRLESRL